MSDNLPSPIHQPVTTSPMPGAPEMILFLSSGWQHGMKFGYASDDEASGTSPPAGANIGYIAWVSLNPRCVQINPRFSAFAVDYDLVAVVNDFAVAYGDTVASAVQTAIEAAEQERRRRGC